MLLRPEQVVVAGDAATVTGQARATGSSCSSDRWRGSQNQISWPRACAASMIANVVSPAI